MKAKETAYDRTLKAWVKDYEATNMSPEVRKLMHLATFDLYYGPIGDGAACDPATDEYGNENEWAGYKGFESACKEIKAALSNLPSQLFIDTDCEAWSETEPGVEGCYECEGSGESPNDFEHAEGGKCEVCDGAGYIEPFLENTYKVERLELKVAIVGKELAAYV